MIRHARTGDTVLVKSREMGGRTPTLPWWLVGARGKDDRKQNTLALLLRHLVSIQLFITN
jgi:hypothetical protein